MFVLALSLYNTIEFKVSFFYAKSRTCSFIDLFIFFTQAFWYYMEYWKRKGTARYYPKREAFNRLALPRCFWGRSSAERFEWTGDCLPLLTCRCTKTSSETWNYFWTIVEGTLWSRFCQYDLVLCTQTEKKTGKVQSGSCKDDSEYTEGRLLFGYRLKLNGIW